MKNRQRVMLLSLAGILFVGTALLSERESKTQREIQRLEAELDSLDAQNQLWQIRTASTPDSLKDSSYYEMLDEYRRSDIAAAELSELILVRREQVDPQRVLQWVCGICGVISLMLYLGRLRRTKWNGL